MIIDAAELKRRYLLRIAGIRDNKVYIGPEVVNLDVTNACNLKCRFCGPHEPGNSEKARFFPWEKFLSTICDCVDLNVDQIVICDSGEPTLYPSFRDMMRHLEQQPLHVKLFTNATFPLDYCSDVIKGDHVIINLSAVDRQQYRDLQGEDLFDRVKANIKRLVSLRDAVKPGCKIEIFYILNAVNINQKQKMQDLASQLGVDSVYFKKMVAYEFNRQIILPEDPMPDLGSEKKFPPECLSGWFYIRVDFNGGVSSFFKIDKIQFGNIDKGSFKQFWLSSHMMKMRLLEKYDYLKNVQSLSNVPSKAIL